MEQIFPLLQFSFVCEICVVFMFAHMVLFELPSPSVQQFFVYPFHFDWDFSLLPSHPIVNVSRAFGICFFSSEHINLTYRSCLVKIFNMIYVEDKVGCILLTRC